eukprot:gene14412-biopygen8282
MSLRRAQRTLGVPRSNLERAESPDRAEQCGVHGASKEFVEHGATRWRVTWSQWSGCDSRSTRITENRWREREVCGVRGLRRSPRSAVERRGSPRIAAEYADRRG